MAMRPPKRWSQELARTNQRTASRSTAGKVHICYKSAWTRDWDNVGCGIGTMLDPPKTAPWQDLGTIQLKLLFYSLSSFGTSFRSQKGATKVSGTSKMDPKGVPKRAKEASKTPLRSMIEQILKKCAKRCKPGVRFWTQIDKNLKILSPRSFRNLSLKKHEKWFQNDAKREPEIINVSIYWKRVTFGNYWFYRKKT